MHGPFATVPAAACSTRARRPTRSCMDLGMSSMQVDAPARGFSYTHDAPLDMRMDPSDALTAATLVNEWDERELAQIFHRYGEERFARQIARAIVQRARSARPSSRTLQLVDDHQARDPDAVALRPRASGEARLPGAAHRRQRRARRARGRARERARALPPGRPHRRDRVPLARGPHGQAALRRRRRAAASARPTCPSAAAAARPSSALVTTQGRAPRRRRGRDQPARGVGAPARRAAGGDGVSAVAAAAIDQRARARAARAGARRRHLGAPHRRVCAVLDRHRHAPGGRAAAQQRARRPAGRGATTSSAPTTSCAAPSAASWRRACSRMPRSKQGLVLPPVEIVQTGLAWPVSRQAARRPRPAPQRPAHPADAGRRHDRDLRARRARTVQVQLLDGGALARAAQAQQRVKVPLWAARGPIVDRTGAVLALVLPGRHGGRVAGARARPHGVRAGALALHRRDAGHDPGAHGGQRAVRRSSRAASYRRRGRASSTTRRSARSVVKRTIEPRPSRGASTRRAASPRRSSAWTATASPASSRRATTCSRRARAWRRSRRSTTGPAGDTHWARVLHVREPRAGQDGAADARHAHPARWCRTRSRRRARTGRRRRSRRSCSTRAPAASSRWPRRPACRPPATARATPRSGACARSPTCTSPARRSSS